MNLPYVLVGGFPGTGTSLLAHLVVEMGFNAGPAKNLKGSDEINRWGYWEYLPIRDMAWSAIRKRGERSRTSFREYVTRGFLEYADPRMVDWGDEYSSGCRMMIRQRAVLDDVEMYKDNALPLIWPLFSKHAKYVLTTRKPESCYHRAAQRVSAERWRDAHACYYHLSRQMAAEVPTLFFAYEDFETDLEGQIEMLADFLGAVPDIECLRKLYRPRSRFP